MDLAEFTAEAERIARNAMLLRTKGSGEPVAFWHGLDPGKPCVSVRYNDRWLNVHLDRGDDMEGRVESASRPAKSPMPLFAVTARSLPPVDAVFMLGSSAVEEFLHRNGWDRMIPFNGNFPSEIPGEYERLFQESCPLYSPSPNDTIAVCGGWNVPWPDGDFNDFIDSELVIWTLHESEPWVEVFDKQGAFVVKQRIT